MLLLGELRNFNWEQINAYILRNVTNHLLMYWYVCLLYGLFCE